MKRNHLKKAILLGLIAASIHAPVWAYTGTWDPNAHKDPIVGDLPIESTGIGIGYTGPVTVKPDDAGNGGDLSVTAGSNGIQSGYSEGARIDILANTVTIDSGDNGIFTTVEGG